jgi:hypothetical protein
MTGMNHWNAALKEATLLSFMDEILGVAGKPMSAAKLRKFAQAGLDADDLRVIGELYAKEGSPMVNGVRVTDTRNWNHEVGRRLMAVLRHEVDTAIVTPGAGDLPLVMRTPMGQLIGQFKSFSFTAVQRILIPGVQRMATGDPTALIGFVSQVSLGAAAYGLKAYGYGGKPSTDPEHILREAIDRSGYFGVFTDINAIAEKLTNGTAGLSGLARAMGGQGAELSRYSGRSVVGDLIGPTFGTASDVIRATNAVFQDEILPGDIRALRRLVPYQNHYVLRFGLNEVQEAAISEFAK